MVKTMDCVDIVRPFAEAIADRDDIQLIGGMGSAALQDARTRIVPSEKRIVAPTDLSLPQHRADGNLRDCDVLVLSANQEDVDAVQTLAEETIRDQLELAIFGLKPLSRLQDYRKHPYRTVISPKRSLSDRYVADVLGSDPLVMKALFPFAVPMEPESLETWSLSIGDKDPHPMPIPHPGASILNYLTRSVSGLRPKDEKKVAAMADNIFGKHPRLHDWLVDEQGATQFELARILQTISRPGELAVGQFLKVEPLKPVYDHPSFMLKDAPPPTAFDVVALTYIKARALRFFESSPLVVTMWQRRIEKHATGIVHNN